MVNHQYCEHHSHVEATHYRIKVRTLNSVYRPGKRAGVSSEGFFGFEALFKSPVGDYMGLYLVIHLSYHHQSSTYYQHIY